MKTLHALCALSAALTLAACGTVGPAPSEAKTEIVTVHDPVPVSCAPQIGPAPAYPDTDAALRAAPSLYERTRLITEGRLLRLEREAELEAALKGCSGQ